MRRFVLTIISVALTASACSSVTFGTGSRAVAPGPAGSAPASQRSLQSQLLTLHDMPSGWQVTDSNSSASDAPACLQRARASLPALGDTTAGFSAAAGIPALFELLGQFGTPANVRVAFGEVQVLLDGCSSFDLSSNGVSLHATLTHTTLATVGDQSSAWRLIIGTATGSVGSGAFLIARRGTELLIMLYANLGDSDVREILPFARAAIAKMPR